MSRQFSFKLILVLVFSARALVASTFYVGNCRAGAFATISAAVSTVPAGSIVAVCPGTYLEQVTISQPLTLQGMVTGNSSRVVIAVPGTGLTTTTSIFYAPTVAPQVWVTTGPVNITNIGVDGSGGGCSSGGWLVGIFYSSGSSGTVNQVTVRNQGSSCGLGIVVENGSSTQESVTIANSSVHDVSNTGITALQNLNATIKGNSVTAGVGIVFAPVSGSVTANIVTGVGWGMTSEGGPSSLVSGNTVENSPIGIKVGSGASVKSNKIVNSSTYGIELFVSGVTVQANIITKSASAIRFNCNSGTVSSNTINDAAIGLDNAPTSFTGANTFRSVATNRTGGC